MILFQKRKDRKPFIYPMLIYNIMTYQLVLSELIDEKTRKVGENVFFDNLPSHYEVFMLYYPGAMPNEDLESALRNLGNITGENLFVNIGRLNDPNYKKIANKFDIRNLPVIIVTAIADLASPPKEFSTAFVKIDKKRLLNSPDLIDCLQRLFNLFIQGKISAAFKYYKGAVLISHLKGIITKALRGMKEFIKERDITFSLDVGLAKGKFELRRKGS